MSKSVTLSTSDARTGRKKKMKMRTSAGARNSHAALPTSDGIPVREVRALTLLPGQKESRCSSLCRRLSKQVSPLLQHRVDILVERSQGLINCLCLSYRLLPVLEDRSRDLLPLRHLWQWHHVVELCAKCPRVLVVRERGILPRAYPRRQVASELVKLQLQLWPRQILHDLPCLGLVL